MFPMRLLFGAGHAREDKFPIQTPISTPLNQQLAVSTAFNDPDP